jgi:hypothetical protein
MNPEKRNHSIRIKGEDFKRLQRDLNELVFPPEGTVNSVKRQIGRFWSSRKNITSNRRA